MGLYEDQLAKIQRTEDFLQRQIDLSDENKADVIDALVNNTWGTTNTFYVSGTEVAKSDTSINLDQYLIERGIDPFNIPEYVDSSIFSPEKLETTRAISQQVPEGEGIDLQLVAQIDYKDYASQQDNILKSQTVDLRTFATQEADKVISEQDYINQIKAQEIPLMTSPPNLFNSPVLDASQQEQTNKGGLFGIALLGFMVVAS